MKILVIDGQGGGLGRQLTAALAAQGISLPKLHLQSRNPASDPHWKKEALLYVPEWKADRESALQALPDQL